MKYKRDTLRALKDFIILLEYQPSAVLSDIETDIREFIMLNCEASLIDTLDNGGHMAYIAFDELVIAFNTPTANALEACRCYLKTSHRKPTLRS